MPYLVAVLGHERVDADVVARMFERAVRAVRADALVEKVEGLGA